MRRPHPIHAARRVDAATPLRVKLVLVVLVLASAGLALAATATTASLKSYLVRRVDDQIVAAANSRYASDRYGDFRDPNDFAGPSNLPGTAVIRSGSRPPLPSPFYVVHYNPNGTVNGFPEQAALQTQSPPKLPALTLAKAQALAGHAFTVSSADGHGSWRVVTRVEPDGSGSVVVASSLSDTNHTIHHVIVMESAIGLIAIVLMGLAGYLLIRRSLRPLVAVESTAAAIAGGDLSRRVPQLPGRTEVGKLALAFNQMLSQIENAFAHERRSEQQARDSERRMRQFVADASHELRTPLTSIRGFAELYRIGAADEFEELPRLMQRIEDEAARMGMLVEDLLLLARLDQQRPLAADPVDLLELVSDVVHDAQIVAPDRTVTLNATTGVPAVVRGDEPRLRQVVGNLVSNALSHTPAGTPIDVRLHTDASIATLEVADRGPGIDPTIENRVFERFYRADESRSRQGGGSGLGLSIVAGLVSAHHGEVTVASRDGGGAVFTVTLPLYAEPDATPRDDEMAAID